MRMWRGIWPLLALSCGTFSCTAQELRDFGVLQDEEKKEAPSDPNTSGSDDPPPDSSDGKPPLRRIAERGCIEARPKNRPKNGTATVAGVEVASSVNHGSGAVLVASKLPGGCRFRPFSLATTSRSEARWHRRQSHSGWLTAGNSRAPLAGHRATLSQRCPVVARRLTHFECQLGTPPY